MNDPRVVLVQDGELGRQLFLFWWLMVWMADAVADLTLRQLTERLQLI